MVEIKEPTVLDASVGADAEQSTILDKNSITQFCTNEAVSEKFSMAMDGDIGSLPEEIRKNGKFCVWRFENVGERKSKVPYNPITGEKAKSNDPESFAGFEQVISTKGYDGIGIGIFDGFCAIDLDHCIVNGTLTSAASDIINTMESYTEISPSGDGIHILFRVDGYHFDTGKFYIMNHKQGIEVYVSGATNKYVTVTGRKYNEFSFGQREAQLDMILDRYMKLSCEQATSAHPICNAVNAINAVNDGNGRIELPDSQVINLAMNCKNGEAFQRLWNGDISAYSSHSEADMALCCHLAFWTGKNVAQMDRLFRRSCLMRNKWDRRQNGSTYGAITIQHAIDYCTECFVPSSNVNEPDYDCSKVASVNPVETTSDGVFCPIVPLKPQSSDLPGFPVEAYPDFMRDYVTAVAEHTQTANDMAAVMGLGVLAVCLQGKYQVQGTPGYTEQLSLYTVVIAPPGDRKSSVQHDMIKDVMDYEMEYNATHAKDITENQRQRERLERQITGLQGQLAHKSNEALEEKLKQLQDELDMLPTVKSARFFADDCSSEALTSLMAANHGRIAVLSTEGGIFDIMGGRYSNKVNIDIWLKGWCGDAVRVDRMNREGESIPHPHLSAVLAIQPSVLEEVMANTTMTGRGLMARFLYSSPVSRVGHRVFDAEAIPDTVAVAYRESIFRLMSIEVPKEPITLTLSSEAKILVSKCFQEHEQYLVGEGQDISEWANKYIGTVLRIAGLLHVASTDSDTLEISEDTVDRAFRIGKYFLAHARYAFSIMVTDLSVQKAKFVMAKLRKESVTEIRRQDLFQMCRGKFFKKTEDIQPTLDLLEMHGYIRSEQPLRLSAGRPPDVKIIVNPLAPE